MTLPDESRYVFLKKSRNLELVGASTTECGLIMPRGVKINITSGVDILKRQKFVPKSCETAMGSRLQFLHLHTNEAAITAAARSTLHWLLRWTLHFAPENEYVIYITLLLAFILKTFCNTGQCRLFSTYY